MKAIARRAWDAFLAAGGNGAARHMNQKAVTEATVTFPCVHT